MYDNRRFCLNETFVLIGALERRGSIESLESGYSSMLSKENSGSIPSLSSEFSDHMSVCDSQNISFQGTKF